MSKAPGSTSTGEQEEKIRELIHAMKLAGNLSSKAWHVTKGNAETISDNIKEMEEARKEFDDYVFCKSKLFEFSEFRKTLNSLKDKNKKENDE